MEWFQSPGGADTTVGSKLWVPLLAATGAGLVAWWLGFLKQYLPGPKRAMLLLKNVLRSRAHASEDRFRIVLCWLENDPNGDNTGHVEEAFASVEGATLVRSARIVAASGAADDWRAAMQKEARAVLEDWNADLAVVGLVKQSGAALSLWLVPRSGEGTLSRGDKPYELDSATLGLDFHEDLGAELTAVALVAVAPLADAETRGRVLEQGLRDATGRLGALLDRPAAIEPGRRARLQLSFGNALQILGARERGTERLEQAVDTYRAALEEYSRERVPLDWAMTQHRLGNALQILGARERGTERLEQAVDTYRAALEERTRERVPLDWAATQNNLGVALRTLGDRERGTERLEQAVCMHQAALQEYTRERVPLEWAMTQNNLGTALGALGERENGTERLEQAVDALRKALEERTRERVPLDWAATQNNLGNALRILGERENGIGRLKQAVDAFRAALQEYTRERMPLNWAITQNNLGNALGTLGKRESSTERLQQAVDAYRAALEERTRERVPLDWAKTQNNLGGALGALGKRESSSERLQQAVDAYHAALEERTRERVPLDWAKTQNNLGGALVTLGELERDTERLEQAVDAYRAALEVFSDEGTPRYRTATQNNLANALKRLSEQGSPASEVARYRTGVAGLLARVVVAVGETERWLDFAVDGDEASTRAVLEDDPTAALRMMCALLLRKAKIHMVAVLHANKTGNVHSLAVQMRPVLECAGQVVLIFHNLMIESERGETVVRSYMNADYYRTIIGLTKGDVGHEQLLTMIMEASGMSEEEVRKGSSLQQADKVAALKGGKAWYGYLSEYFCHGRANWSGHSWQGGVNSTNTVLHGFTCAGLMDFLVRQVAVMNAYAALCPVAGEMAHGRIEATLAQLHEVRATTKALRDGSGLAPGNADVEESG